ncbi:MAG: hypothetical protein N2596_02960 [Syntrophorhabdaceae bacterium]|nr:hypothetical protein [Syntrophorhabdaceae bacterium]
MKKAIILIFTVMFFFSMFWHINIVNALLIFLGIALSFALYRIPDRIILSMKYPFIVSQFALTALFFIYPHIHYKHYMEAPVEFIAFYSILFYLVSLKDNIDSLFKEVLATSILFFSAFFNLLMINKPAFIISISLPVILFLFIKGHNRVIPFLAGYLIIILMVLILKKIPIVGNGFSFNNEIQRYMLILAPLLLFIWSFIRLVKDTSVLKVISFMVLLFVMLDIMITVGIRFSSSILYQPLTAILILSPVAGIMMREGKG